MTLAMTKLFRGIRKVWDELRNSPNIKLSLNYAENGFWIESKVWPFPTRKEHKIGWDDIARIDICLAGGAAQQRALFFKLLNGKHCYVYEETDCWDALAKQVSQVFAGFNQHNLKEIEMVGKLFNEGRLPCWDRENKVENLKVDLTKRSDSMGKGRFSIS